MLRARVTCQIKWKKAQGKLLTKWASLFWSQHLTKMYCLNYRNSLQELKKSCFDPENGQFTFYYRVKTKLWDEIHLKNPHEPKPADLTVWPSGPGFPWHCFVLMLVQIANSQNGLLKSKWYTGIGTSRVLPLLSWNTLSFWGCSSYVNEFQPIWLTGSSTTCYVEFPEISHFPLLNQRSIMHY